MEGSPRLSRLQTPRISSDDDHHPHSPLPDLVEGELEQEVEDILNERIQRGKKQYRRVFRWKSTSGCRKAILGMRRTCWSSSKHENEVDY